MDETYIVPKLLALAKLMYSSSSEVFAKYSERRGKYIFGCILPFGKTAKSVVDRSVAIYLVLHELPKNKENNDTSNTSGAQRRRRTM